MINKKYIALVPWIIIVGLIFFLFFSGGYRISKNTEVVIKTDTIVKTVIIPEKTGTFTNVKPQPIYIVPPQDDKQLEQLYEKIANLQDDNQRMEYLLEQLSSKVYAKKYEDDTVSITVTDSINGLLRNQNVQWSVKPQKIEVKEVHTTTRIKPKWTISAGLGVSSKISLEASPTATLVLGFKNKKGTELMGGYSTDQTASIILKKDIFTKY
jgi:hypothetical protein